METFSTSMSSNGCPASAIILKCCTNVVLTYCLPCPFESILRRTFPTDCFLPSKAPRFGGRGQRYGNQKQQCLGTIFSWVVYI